MKFRLNNLAKKAGEGEELAFELICGGVKTQSIRWGHIIFTSNILCSPRRLKAPACCGFSQVFKSTDSPLQRSRLTEQRVKVGTTTLAFLNLHLSFTSPECQEEPRDA